MKLHMEQKKTSRLKWQCLLLPLRCFVLSLGSLNLHVRGSNLRLLRQPSTWPKVWERRWFGFEISQRAILGVIKMRVFSGSVCGHSDFLVHRHCVISSWFQLVSSMGLPFLKLTEPLKIGRDPKGKSHSEHRFSAANMLVSGSV